MKDKLKNINLPSFKSLCHIVWIFNAIFLATFSQFVGEGFEYIPLYCFINLLFVIFLHLPIRTHDNSFPFNFWIFILGAMILIFSTPLYENDFYRYLWEGKAIWNGINPYTHSPQMITQFTTQYKEKIGYSFLTTVYPPIALLYFTIFGTFSLFIGKSLMLIANSILVWFFLKKLWKIKQHHFLFLISLPFLQKEFIQSIHIDILAAFFLVHSLNGKSFHLAFSIGTKVVPILCVPFYFKEHFSNKNLISFIVPMVILLAICFCANFDNIGNGITSFGQNWIWSPGLYSLLHSILNIGAKTSRMMCIAFFLIFYLIIYYNARSRSFYENQVLIMSAVSFFSPVCNAWYFIYLLIFSYLSNNRWGIYYCVLSFICYIPFFSIGLSLYTSLIHHLFFLIICYSYFRKKSV